MLNNVVTCALFHAQHGLRQGYPLSSMLFLFVAKGLNILLTEAKRGWGGDLMGTTVAGDLTITHLMSVDDILLFFHRSMPDLTSIKVALSLFKKVINMQVNS